jgi:hypothetical protein
VAVALSFFLPSFQGFAEFQKLEATVITLNLTAKQLAQVWKTSCPSSSERRLF